MISTAIQQLVNYGLDTGLILPDDEIYIRNQLLMTMQLDSFTEPEGDICYTDLESILKTLVDDAVARGVCEDHRAGVLALGAAQPLTAFLVTEIRDGAAVDDIDIGPFLVGDDGVAVFLKQLCQCASFVLIYLAAQGVKSYPHGFVSFTYRIAFLL